MPQIVKDHSIFITLATGSHLEMVFMLLAAELMCPICAALVSSGYFFDKYSTMNPIGLLGFSISRRSTI